LTLLDLSAASETVDHCIKLRLLQISFGFDGPALQWFRSYLSGRTQAVRRGSQQSAITAVPCGNPQGSFLGPTLFILQTPVLVKLIERHCLSPHLYMLMTVMTRKFTSADRPQKWVAYYSCLGCTDDILSWMRTSNRPNSYGLLTSRRFRQLTATSIRVGSETIRSIRRSLPTAALQTLVVSLVLSRPDYGNAAFVGIPAYLLRHLQAVFNAAARSIAGLPCSAHISISLAGLHWLGAVERAKFKLPTLTYRFLHGTAPGYLSALLRRVADAACHNWQSGFSDRCCN
jgi:Reverse transcriptase (RNA-dependent DNA polymerase)